MCLDRPAATARGARASRAGRDDHTFFRMTKTDPIDRAVGKVLSQLGGIDCPQGHPVDCVFPMPDAKDAEFVDKSPIFLTSDSVHLVHEPEVCDETVNVSIDKDRILRDELPEPAARWDGGWHGTADSRLDYLRAHKGLWAFTRTCIRKTAVFFVPKKDGNLRKILACCNFNDACHEPPHTRLPGTWQIQKVRFRKKAVLYRRERCVCVLLSDKKP